jgi:hypothetical protein
MSVGFKYFYLFDGRGGCNSCAALTKFYDNPPSRPHPHCDCPVYSYLKVADYEVYYKNKVTSGGATYEQTHQGVRQYSNTSDATVSVSLKVSKTVKGSISASAEIKEIFNISATYETSKTIEDTVSVTLKPKQGVELNVVGILKTYTFSAERWYKATFINGEVRHIFDAQISGEAVAVSGGRVTVTNL